MPDWDAPSADTYSSRSSTDKTREPIDARRKAEYIRIRAGPLQVAKETQILCLKRPIRNPNPWCSSPKIIGSYKQLRSSSARQGAISPTNSDAELWSFILSRR